jgi:hypothetical protein
MALSYNLNFIIFPTEVNATFDLEPNFAHIEVFINSQLLNFILNFSPNYLLKLAIRDVLNPALKRDLHSISLPKFFDRHCHIKYYPRFLKF